MHRFFGKPTRGGQLTILNCMLWAIVAIGVATQQPVLMLPAILAWWPLAWLFVPTISGRDSAEGMVAISLVIGMNSLLWGYGLSGLISAITAMRRRSGPEGAKRGFDVIAPHPVESPPVRISDTDDSEGTTNRDEAPGGLVKFRSGECLVVMEPPAKNVGKGALE
jgi:hypothetical protein